MIISKTSRFTLDQYKPIQLRSQNYRNSRFAAFSTFCVLLYIFTIKLSLTILIFILLFTIQNGHFDNEAFRAYIRALRTHIDIYEYLSR